MSAADRWRGGRLVVVGTTHHTTPLDLRERLAFDRVRWYACADGLVPTVLLSTCNRVEVYAWVQGRTARDVARIQRAMAASAGIPLAELRPHLFAKSGLDALVHLVRVAAGLDSLVLGDEQIRAQVREAHRLARDVCTLPSQIDGIFRHALEASRRLRADSFLGRQPSVATAAVRAAFRLPELRGAAVAGRLAIVLGAGAMAKSAARALLERDARVVLLNRTPAHADRVRAELSGRVETGALSELPSLLPGASLLVATTAARNPVVTASMLHSALAERSPAPLVILDIAVPRDVEPAVREVGGVRLLDLDDLERLCPIDVATRRAEIERAEGMARQEAQAGAEEEGWEHGNRWQPVYGAGSHPR